MESIYKEELKKSYKCIGRPSKLSAEDKVLMMLEYNREHRFAAYSNPEQNLSIKTN